MGGIDPVTLTTVFGLVPGTGYQFMVLARNRLGDGLFSNVVNARTSGETPRRHLVCACVCSVPLKLPGSGATGPQSYARLSVAHKTTREYTEHGS